MQGLGLKAKAKLHGKNGLKAVLTRYTKGKAKGLSRLIYRYGAPPVARPQDRRFGLRPNQPLKE